MLRVADNDHTRGQALYAINAISATRDIIASIPPVFAELAIRNPNPAIAVIEAVETWTRTRSKPEVNADDPGSMVH